jgi:hydrogenase expression/formation protein HypC
MCIALPYRVVDVPDPATAVVSRQGVTTTVSLLTADTTIAAGDWVLVHSGLVLARLSDEDARQLDALAIEGGLT